MNFSKLIADDTGAPSTMRVAVLVIVFAVVGTWAAVSVMNKAMQPMDNQMVTLVIGSLLSKAAQSYAENKTPAPTP